MSWITLGLLLWMMGAGCHWWPGPLHVMTAAYRRATNRWSEADDTADDDADDMSRHDDDWDELPDGDGVRYVRRLAGPRPLDELRAEAGLADDDQDDDPRRGRDPWQPRPDEDRLAWVERQWRRGARTTDIADRGADQFGCTGRTIQRDLQDLRTLADDAEQGTMGRDR
jgi:hypothetical protein